MATSGSSCLPGLCPARGAVDRRLAFGLACPTVRPAGNLPCPQFFPPGALWTNDRPPTQFSCPAILLVQVNEPVEFFVDRQRRPRALHNLQDATVWDHLHLRWPALQPLALYPTFGGSGLPAPRFVHGGTRTTLRPEGDDGTRSDKRPGNEFAEFASFLCMELHAAGRLFAFVSSAPFGNYPNI